jgi:hypothetical protein
MIRVEEHKSATRSIKIILANIVITAAPGLSWPQSPICWTSKSDLSITTKKLRQWRFCPQYWLIRMTSDKKRARVSGGYAIYYQTMHLYFRTFQYKIHSTKFQVYGYLLCVYIMAYYLYGLYPFIIVYAGTFRMYLRNLSVLARTRMARPSYLTGRRRKARYHEWRQLFLCCNVWGDTAPPPLRIDLTFSKLSSCLERPKLPLSLFFWNLIALKEDVRQRCCHKCWSSLQRNLNFVCHTHKNTT